jgi:hypothetical protein
MRAYFAEVLGRETACLATVTDAAALAVWRRRLVEELMTPQSPYVKALKQTGDVRDRARFLDRWRELIAETVDRVLQSGATGDAFSSSGRGLQANVDAQKTAVLILAALHGGSILSQVAQDPEPLNAALDLALAPFTVARGNGLARLETSIPMSDMDS